MGGSETKGVSRAKKTHPRYLDVISRGDAATLDSKNSFANAGKGHCVVLFIEERVFANGFWIK